MTHPNTAVTLSARILPELLDQLNELSVVTGRSKSFLTAEAIENYLEIQAWQSKAVNNAIKKANSKNAKFVDHDKVLDWVNSWGSKDEKEMPKW